MALAVRTMPWTSPGACCQAVEGAIRCAFPNAGPLRVLTPVARCKTIPSQAEGPGGHDYEDQREAARSPFSHVRAATLRTVLNGYKERGMNDHNGRCNG